MNITKKEINILIYNVYGYENGNYIISHHFQPKKFTGEKLLWILPKKDFSLNSMLIKCEKYECKRKKNTMYITLIGDISVSEFDARPTCDFFCNFYNFNFEFSKEFEKTYSHFYWDNLLCQMAERTFMRKKKKIREGYVLSTLNEKYYGGTYPAVDHEFHFKGRFAVGGEIEKSLLKRMLELQFMVMREDKKGLSRNVCSIQPNGKREYDVWRYSKDKSVKAQMFRITANIEIVENIYLYYSMTKDINFLKNNILALEKNCEYIISFIEKEGFLNSHVYYEDQVIKNAYVNQAQCFAYNTMCLMEQIELLLQRNERVSYYKNISNILKAPIINAYPKGFWDSKNERFIDYIDKDGNIHDHIHLLANILPILFNISTNEQQIKCEQLIKNYENIFSKFPSFVAAKIEDYTNSEIGTGGAYDLCAAGRYWCWDASYKAFKKESENIFNQLKAVSNEAKNNGYFMGERYDMNYVYYKSDINWHGAGLYYEYPNVFIYVLMSMFLGIKFSFLNDLNVTPLLFKGSVKSENHGIEYDVSDEIFTIKNLKNTPIKINLDLTGINFNFKKLITLNANEVYKINRN